MEDAKEIILQQAEEAIKKLGTDIVTAEQVAESVLQQAIYWEKATPNGDKLVFIRFHSPIVNREEVFLGNILFNSFLSKAFARVASKDGASRVELISNDLENYYFLVLTKSDIAQLSVAFYEEVESSLFDLFFGAEDQCRGIYGDLSRMFTFRKSDFEPFVVYAIPQFLVPFFEKAVRKQIFSLLESIQFPNRVRTILASIAFFYGRTSGGNGDAQSFPNFVEHLVKNQDYDRLLKSDNVKEAFNISEVTKPAIKQSIDDEIYNTEGLRLLLFTLMKGFQASIDNGSTKWLMGFLYKDKKFIELSPSDYLKYLLGSSQLGYFRYFRQHLKNIVPCRLCNIEEAVVEERYVTTGLGSFKFDNQSIRRQSEKVCARCALFSYLSQKLLGTEMISAGGKLPQVPKTYNLIFHYGKHNDEDIESLVSRIDLIWSLIRQRRDAERLRREIIKQKDAIKEKREREKDVGKKLELENKITGKEVELQRTQVAISNIDDQIFISYPWLKETESTFIPADNCSLDTLLNIQLSETKVERHVLGLGMGGYRMMLFILPQIRPPRDESRDYAQRRFSFSRVTVTTVLSFLRELCGCDGPFYYQSLPALTSDSFKLDTFYVGNEHISVKKVQENYELITQVAWKLVRRRKTNESGQELFVRKVLLAEQLLNDPLACFSTVMRDSPIMGLKLDSKKTQFKRLPGSYRQDWRAQDLTEYAKYIKKLSKMQEVK